MSITSLFDCRIKKYAYKDIDSITRALTLRIVCRATSKEVIKSSFSSSVTI